MGEGGGLEPLSILPKALHWRLCPASLPREAGRTGSPLTPRSSQTTCDTARPPRLGRSWEEAVRAPHLPNCPPALHARPSRRPDPREAPSGLWAAKRRGGGGLLTQPQPVRREAGCLPRMEAPAPPPSAHLPVKGSSAQVPPLHFRVWPKVCQQPASPFLNFAYVVFTDSCDVFWKRWALPTSGSCAQHAPHSRLQPLLLI